MTRRVYTPRAYAPVATQHMLDHPRCALFAGMGMGKTTILEVLLDSIHNVMGEDQPTLVLGPLRVARDTWSDEAQKWDVLADLEIVPIVGDLKQRQAALRKRSQVYTCNYEQVPWLVEQLGDRWPFANVVPDESTRLKGFRLKQGGVRAQALAKVAWHRNTRRWIELTGTPASNGLQDLWGQLWFLDQGQRLGRTYSGFMERWFQAVPGGDGYSQTRPLSFAQDQIQGAIKDLCLTLDPRDWFDLAAPIVNKVPVKLPKAAQVLYRQMERECFIQLQGVGIEAFNAASKTIKCLQLASGAIYTSPDPKNNAWAAVHDEKLQALDSIMQEANGMPLLVAYHFVPDKERILKAFHGAVDLATKEGMATFKAGKARIGVAHPQSLGHGVDGLQYVTNIAVFYSHWWALEYHDQIIERIGPMRQFQAGMDRGMFIHYIVTENTLDEQVIERHASKRGVQDLLLEAMKARYK